MTAKYTTTSVAFSKETLREILELQDIWGESRSRVISRCVSNAHELMMPLKREDPKK